MGIELISKNIYWYGTKGTILDIRARLTTDTGRRLVDIHIEGISEPLTTINADTYFMMPTAAIHEWLQVKGYMQEWELEATKYRYVISQVDLPADAAVWSGHIAYRSHGLGESDRVPSLTYKLMMGEIQFFLSVVVRANYEGAVAYVGIQEPDEYYEEYSTSYVRVGEVPLTYPITVASVRAAVGPAMDAFLSKAGQLASEPLVEEPPPEDFYGR